MFASLKNLLNKLWYLISPVLSGIGTFLDYIGSERACTIFYILSTYLVVLGIRKLKTEKKYKLKLKPQAQRNF